MDNLRRRSPRQSRSKVTCEAILTATTQVLLARGYSGTTTNHVAEVAGVSIGTLYQYYGNKNDLVRAVVEKHTDEIFALLRHTLLNLADAPIPMAVRTFVNAMMKVHAVDPRLHRICLEQAFHLGLDHILSIRDAAQGLVAAYLTQYADRILPKDLNLAASVLVITVDSIAHGTMLQDNPPDMNAVGEESIAVILRYLGVADTQAVGS
jgi:AcrR family transcriptional regulator